MSERSIGKVISVDSFRVYIRLDDDLKSLYKSGYEDIYEVARINSYVIIPIGADKIVGMVTSVRAQEETELGKNKEAIFLTKSSRYLVATMIGTIENTRKYMQGVYNYPILDNPVWYVTREDLNSIFDQKNESEVIDFNEDFYLPIGTSPSFSDYKIKINPDKFFGKHAAILGNTGSGKSCTFASIIQSLFDFSYNGKKLKNAHIIIFDTNGEYKAAFQGKEGNPYKNFQLVNPFNINKEGLKVPFWFMNFADFDFLFEPTAGTQAPIFKRALGLAKNQITAKAEKKIPQSVLSVFQTINDIISANAFPLKKFIFDESEDFLKEFQKLEIDFDKTAITDALTRFASQKGRLKENGTFLNGHVDSLEISEIQIILNKELTKYNVEIQNSEVIQERNIDLPIWFNFQELLSKYFEVAINEQESSNNKIREYVSTLRLRLQSYLGDERLSEPLMLKNETEVAYSLAKFISFILGDFCHVYNGGETDPFTNYYERQLAAQGNEQLAIDLASQVTIIDMSLLPFEVLETITGLIGRLILEFVSRFPESDRGKLPIVIALEEAQNYIPEKNRGDKESIAKRVFERIAREGRKHGISLLVSSQRPSELSKTVLSQCNSFIIHRLQNPEDQKYVRQLVSAANEDILQQLPILPQQHVVIMGDAVRTPVYAKMNTANPRPNSSNPKFIENWTNDLPAGFPNYVGIADAWEKGEKYPKSPVVSEIPVDVEASLDSTTMKTDGVNADEDDDLPF